MLTFMKYLIFVLGFQLMLILGNNQVSAFTCEGPNPDLNRVACITSCSMQNCATGYCTYSTCVCSRCKGGSVLN